MSKKISVGNWAYIWGGYADKPVPLTQVVEGLQKMHFDGIEFGPFAPHLSLDEASDPNKVRAVKKLFDDHGLGVSAIAGDFGKVPPPYASLPDYIDVVLRHVEICQILGTNKIRTDLIIDVDKMPLDEYETAFWRSAHLFRIASDVAGKHGVQFVWEFEPEFFVNKPSQIVRMCHAVGHPNFGVLFDSCHAHMVGVVGARQKGEKETLPGGVVQFAHMLTGWIKHVHFIDSDQTLHDDRTSTHAPFGQGVLDFQSIIQALNDAGYKDEWWPMDLCYWPGALEATGPAKKFMDQLVAKYG
jgi:sugar phosphate isomerase/epimerase